MKLYAISDLHIAYQDNRQALSEMSHYPDDWLIVAGDIGETEQHFHFTLETLTQRFAQVIWVPGNHDLWTMPTEKDGLRGVAKYEKLVDICRSYNVLTPEDPYVVWPGNPSIQIAPLFLLYDYSFRPDHIQDHEALAWAEETNVVCTDEVVLHPAPYPSRQAWCAARCQATEVRLAEAAKQGGSLILINHFPLRQDLAVLPRIPRFSLWCGTRHTDDWHTRFPVECVVYGHLHIRGTRYRDNVRFEEVSLGYPRQWDVPRGVDAYLREIL